MRIMVEIDHSNTRIQGRLLVEATDSATVGDLLSSLGLSANDTAYVGATVLDPGQLLSLSPIVDGVTIGHAPSAAMRASDSNEIAVLTITLPTGETRSHSLSAGEYVVGRNDASDIVVKDLAVSARHLLLSLDSRGISCTDLGGLNGTYVDGSALTTNESISLPRVCRLEIGDTYLDIQPILDRAELSPSGDGGIHFNRPSRIREQRDIFTVSLPAEINGREMQIDLLSSAAGSATSLAYGSFIPFIGAGVNVALQKHRQRKSKRQLEKLKAEYEAKLRDIEATIAGEVRHQENERRTDFPNPELLLEMTRRPSRRLWERRGPESQSLEVSLGTGTAPALIDYEYRGTRRGDDAPRLNDVPITIDLQKLGVLGISGPLDVAMGVAHWILGQLMFERSPSDTKIGVLSSRALREGSEWIGWSSHASFDFKASRPIYSDSPESANALVQELVGLLDARKASTTSSRPERFLPDVVVLMPFARELRSIPGFIRILQEGPTLGIYAIAVDETPSRLPEECRGEFEISNEVNGQLRVDGDTAIADIAPVVVTTSWLVTLSRLLSPVRLINPNSVDSLPTSLQFMDMFEVDFDDVDRVARNWNLPSHSPQAWVGVSSIGPMIIDISRDGPHALIAGSTGSGKSAFLQTFVSALAFSQPPSALNFVLVDYKGASAFAECADFPHTVGMVTNLDGHLTERALVSLNAEIDRRQVILKEMGAPDIEAAWERDAIGASHNGLARLLIVIDEFAEMVQDLPDFMAGLIHLSRVGRSLGIHLILATQRPSGNITPEMRANTSLRIALRIEESADSVDVIGDRAASQISKITKGRALVRLASTGQLIEFQTAQINIASRNETAAPAVRIAAVPDQLTDPDTLFADSATTSTDLTDIARLSLLLRQAAAATQQPVPRRPWLDPLRVTVRPSDIDEMPTSNARGKLSLSIGVIDVPMKQAQEPWTIDLEAPVNLGVAGASKSGRTTFLQTVAAEAARRIAPDYLHIYALDLGGGGLAPLTALTHCAAVVRGAETERCETLTRRLLDEHRRRQTLMAERGTSHFSELRDESEQPLPLLMVLIDRWDVLPQDFALENASNVISDLTRLIREGAGTGFRFFLTGDRGLLTDRVNPYLSTKLSLHLSDSADYRQLGLRPQDVPASMPPGRAVTAASALEVQIALPFDESGTTLREQFAALSTKWGPRSLNQIRVDLLPETIHLDAAASLSPHPASHEACTTPMFIGGDALQQICLDPWSRRLGFLVLGPSRSGRSTTASLFARDAAQRNRDVRIFATNSASAYSDMIEKGAATLLNADVQDADSVLPRLEGVLVVVDDADQFVRTPLGIALADPAQWPKDLRVILVSPVDDVANDLRGLAALLKRDQCGVILRPQAPLDGQVYGQRIDRGLLGGPPGRGILFLDGQQIRVQAVSP